VELYPNKDCFLFKS